LQEHKTHSHVRLSPLKCCVLKSATQLNGTQVSGNLSGILAMHPE